MRCLLTLLTALLGFTAAQAYVPLVREGVEWIYHEAYYSYYSEFNADLYERFYTVDFEGDTLINGQRFSRCFRKELSDWPNTALDTDGDDWRTSDNLWVNGIHPVAYLRDNDGKTTCYERSIQELLNSNYHHPDIPAEPIVLYDFNTLKVYNATYVLLDSVEVEGQSCRRFAYDWDDTGDYMSHYPDACPMIVESVGFDAWHSGDLLMPYRQYPDCICSDNYLSLVCVRNKADGRIIYKGRGFEYWPFASEPADVNGDAVVDVTDLGLVIDAALGLNALPDADVNGDGTVDVADINAVITAMLDQ